MEELQARHRKELRDLQSRVTQKKKQASKKTRKAVNDECDRLEADLKDTQAKEVAVLNGEAVDGNEDAALDKELEDLTLKVDDVENTNGVKPDTSDSLSTTAEDNSQPGKKRNRQKDRLARRAAEQEELARKAAEEAQNLPDLKEQERTRMLEAMKAHGLVEKEIRADGHCLYSAVADQLEQLQIPMPNAPDDKASIPYKAVRAKAAEYISTHEDEFVPFLEEPLPNYLHKIRDTAEWGGQMELIALAKTFGADINVLQDFGRVEKIESGVKSDDGGGKAMWLGYYKHGFGLGEHYNSLRKNGP